MRKSIVTVVIFVIAGVSFGQMRQPNEEFFKEYGKKSKETKDQELSKRLQERSQQQPVLQAVEGPIDPETYIVGPGDVFRINFWGLSNDGMGIITSVTPEGNLTIPTVGTIDVRNKSLQDVRERIRTVSEVKYDRRATTVTAHLTQLRLVRAHVYGEVKLPGSYIGTAVDRISHFIQQAGGWTEWAAVRNVKVRHQDGTVDTLDFYKLYQEGELGQDIHVRGGDVVYVPHIELTNAAVILEGTVDMPGPHQIAENESLVEFLYRVKALSRETDFKEIFLIRKYQKPVRVSLFGDAADGANAYSLHLKNGDRIVVSGLREYVYVHGAVKNAGSFPFIVGYKAADYVGLAGGTVNMGSLSGVEVVRRETGKVEKGANVEVNRGDSIIVPESARTKITQYLSIAAQIATLLIAASAVGLLN